MVHVEITESALNGDSQVMPRAIEHFHEMGLEVWMDDFGSGYSSLNVLKDYRFNVIKIDMVFLRKFDERSRVIVRSICEMAHSWASGPWQRAWRQKSSSPSWRRSAAPMPRGISLASPARSRSFSRRCGTRRTSGRKQKPSERLCPGVEADKKKQRERFVHSLCFF